MMTSHVVGSWLLTYALHSALLLGMAWGLTRRIGSPGVREWVWKTALVGGIITTTLHTSGVGLARTTFAVTDTRSAVVSAASAVPDPTATADDRVETGRSPVVVKPGLASKEPSTPLDWTRLALGAWAGVAGALVLGFAVRRWQLARWLGGRRLVVDHPAAAEMAEFRRVAGVRRGLVLTVCDRLASPIAVGVSEVSVPALALRELEADQRRSMLAHEVAHLVRFDPSWLAVASLVERIFFFQPLNRVASRAIQADAELLCDAQAARWTGSGVDLAKCLVKVAEWIDSAPRPIAVAGLAEERSQLVNRVRRLVEEVPQMSKSRLRLIVAGVGTLLVGTAFVAPRVTVVGQDPVRRTERHVAGLTGTPGGLGPIAGVGAVAGVAGMVGRLAGRATSDTNSAVVPALIEALKDTNGDVRRAAAQSLGAIGDRRAVAGLVAILADEHLEARVAAAQALGQIQDPKAIAGLAARLQDSSVEMRRAAIQALGQMERGVSAATLRPSLDDTDAEIRQAAAQALGQLKDVSSQAALARLVTDANADVRCAAIQALSNFELTSVPGAVIEALKDRNAEVRQAAASLVGGVGDVAAVPALKQLLADPNADVREAAVNALSAIRDEAAIDALVAGLKSSDPVVRRAAAEALGQRHEN